MSDDPQFHAIQNLFLQLSNKLDQTHEQIQLLRDTFEKFNENMDDLLVGFDRRVDRLIKTFEIIFHTQEIETAKQSIIKISQRLEAEFEEKKVAELLNQLIETVQVIQSEKNTE
ncbi:MAG: hypothetical protein ACTSRW_05135 [Candidatus Helarchaeota archaeon]